MKPRDAVITFQCSAPDFVQVYELVDGQQTCHQKIQRHPDVVAEMEKRYIFFAKQADIARDQLKRGRSCAFSVYFREP